MTSGGDGIAAPKVTADVGIITALSAGSNANMTIEAGPAGQIKSFQFESTATNVPPIKTSSSVKCVNLNADLLDGLTMIDKLTGHQVHLSWVETPMVVQRSMLSLQTSSLVDRVLSQWNHR